MTAIEHVSDTAIWVAYYRAEETKRPDALFKDPLAEKLIGARGAAIAGEMSSTAKYTRQNVVIRTFIIDQFIRELVASGVETIVNLGAGLDTRPYRLDLPSAVKWIEVDYPHVIAMKNETLASDRPRVQLERVAMDLANLSSRRELFARLNNGRVAILTEGVLPYLSVEDVASLADDLHANPAFEYWICDYMSPAVYKYINNPERMKKMKNAPFKFFPPDPLGFFSSHGWTQHDIRYIQQTTHELGRPMPAPWFAHIFKFFAPRAMREQFLKTSGYMILKRK
jgi:methyltransferase (TIGR00027 family)